MGNKVRIPKVGKETFSEKFDINKYYKKISIIWLNKDGSRVNGRIVMVNRKNKKEVRVVKETFTRKIDINDYFRKLIIRKLNEE